MEAVAQVGGRLDALKVTDSGLAAYLVASEKLQGHAYVSRLREVQLQPLKVWDEVEKGFAPKRAKDGGAIPNQEAKQ